MADPTQKKIPPIRVGDRRLGSHPAELHEWERRPIATRGLLEAAGGAARRLETVHSLVQELRRRVQGLPLTILAHGWTKENPTGQFVSILGRSLRIGNDAIWLVREVSPQRDAAAGRAPTGAIVLDPAVTTDASLYQNLYADLVLFPASSGAEVDLVAELAARSRAVVVDKLGEFSEDVWRRASELGLELYCWRREGVLEIECGLAQQAEVEPTFAAARLNSELLDRIGEDLKNAASDLEAGRYRRYVFGRRLQEVLEDNPEHATWNEDPLRLANRFEWPRWAVECVPTLLTPIPGAEGGRQRALMWDLILECLPTDLEHETRNQLCGGRIVESDLSPEAWALAARVAESLKRSVGDSPYWSDGVFYSRLADGLLDLLLVLKESDPTAARQIERARRQLLRAANLPIKPGGE